MHSGREPNELQVRVSAEAVEASEKRASGAQRTCCIVYGDNGRGIREELRGRIFDPFFTTQAQGNGLGLAIAQRFLQRQGGRIAEEGREEGGARFCVYLPVAEPVTTEGGEK